MEKQNTSDKRKFVRVNVTSLVVIKCDVRISISDNETYEFHTHTEDISEGGINVILDRELHSPEMVEVRLYLTGKLKPIECKGQVAWSKAVSPEGVKPALFSTGIKFIDISNDIREDINRVVSCFLEDTRQ